jgi:tRNA-dihydrouridine synthase A
MTIYIAPMLKYTDRYFRHLIRILSKHTVLFTEMIAVNSILYGDADKYLTCEDTEHPIFLQLGGSEPKDLAECAKLAEARGFDAINLNLGCPSKRVQKGNFGARLMQDTILCQDCIKAMRDVVSIPINIKTRTGVNDNQTDAWLYDFIGGLHESGCNDFFVHARPALLNKTPRANRSLVAPDYTKVYRLKKRFPHLKIVINGDIKTQTEIQEHLKHVDGVMLGRVAYKNPYMFAEFDQCFFAAKSPILGREQATELYLQYAAQEIAKGTNPQLLLRPMLGMLHGMPNKQALRCELQELMMHLPPV